MDREEQPGPSENCDLMKVNKKVPGQNPGVYLLIEGAVLGTREVRIVLLGSPGLSALTDTDIE